MHVALALGSVKWVTAVPFGSAPVERHDDWQFAYVALQVIMQVVVTEVCASRIFPLANASAAKTSIANSASKTVNPRIFRIRPQFMSAMVAQRCRPRNTASESVVGPKQTCQRRQSMSASLIGRLGSSTFRLSAAAVSMSLTGSRFSSESAPRPFHHGIRGRGGTIFTAALPSNERQVQADMRTHLIRRPARDIIPPLGGARVSFYWI
jgi:hypothetical protein